MTISRDSNRALTNTSKGWIATAAVFLILGAIVYSTAYRVSFFGEGTPTSVINTKVGIDSNNVPLTPKADQVSPQGPTGPLDTKSGGVPAGNPRGETAPGMQSGPGATPSTAE